MKNLSASLFTVTLLFVAGCGSGGEHESYTEGARAMPAEGMAIVVGTCLDGDTGEALAGVEITGLAGQRARSDERGRFVLDDLPEGTQGNLVAVAKDGRRATNPILPLKHERLEVVLHLR